MGTIITKLEANMMPVPVQIDLPKWIWRAIKIEAANRDSFAKDLVAEALIGHFQIKPPTQE
jgi:hypothetical protein